MSRQTYSIADIQKVELSKVLLFVKENKSKIYMSPEDIGSYPIDCGQVLKVIDNINNKSTMNPQDKSDTINFFSRLIQIFKYITFDEFLETIRNICNNIKEYLIVNHCKYKKIFFGGYGFISKSYTWVLFLFLDNMNNFFEENQMIRDKILVIIDNDSIDNNINFKDNVSDNYLYLYFDDMSYSGTQMEGSIPKNDDSINVDIYISAPFISETAKTKLLNKNANVKFWASYS